MILHPGGSAFMPLTLLDHSPFHSYLIPGIVLLAANGVLSLAVLWLVLMRNSYHGLWIVLQGAVLLVWLVIECWMLRTVVWLHWFYAALALVLIFAGSVLRRAAGYG